MGTYLVAQVKWIMLHPGGSKNQCELHLMEVRKTDLEVIAVLSTSYGGSNGTVVMAMSMVIYA